MLELDCNVKLREKYVMELVKERKKRNGSCQWVRKAEVQSVMMELR